MCIQMASCLQAAAEAVGKKIAELCKVQNIEKVAFDRGGFVYHGRVAVSSPEEGGGGEADGARRGSGGRHRGKWRATERGEGGRWAVASVQ